MRFQGEDILNCIVFFLLLVLFLAKSFAKLCCCFPNGFETEDIEIFWKRRILDSGLCCVMHRQNIVLNLSD